MLAFTFVGWLLFLLRVSGVIALDLTTIDFSSVPACGLTCIVVEVSASPCNLTNSDCICANATLAADIQACLTAECSVRDALTVAKIAKDMCGVVPHDKSLVVWVVPLVAVITSGVFYVLRIISRLWVSRQGIELGDVIMGICVLCSAPFLWSAFELKAYGLGQDIWNIPADNVTAILRLYWIDELLYQAILPLSRISILLFYLKIFPQPRIRIWTWALIGFNLAYLVGFEVATVFQCLPVDGAWRFWDGTYDAKCNNIQLQSWIAAGINIGIDVACLILPLPLVGGLAISMRKKFQILTMFSLGFSITVISVIRLKALVVFANTTNVTYDYVNPGLYSIAEASAGIVCSCLPAVRALLSGLWPRVFPQTQNASDVENGGSNAISSHQFNRLGSLDGGSRPSSRLKVQTEWSVTESSNPSTPSHELFPVEKQDRIAGRSFHEERYEIHPDGLPGQAF